MKIMPINYATMRKSPNFNAKLEVDKDVTDIVQPNKDNFRAAINMYRGWLESDNSSDWSTIYIRKNTDPNPKTVQSEIVYNDPNAPWYKEPERIKVDNAENLEFQRYDKKYGFWFDPTRDAYSLFQDFQKMYYALYYHKDYMADLEKYDPNEYEDCY